MLLKEGLITEERVRMILSWRHTGFHIHNEGKVVANDTEGRERLARYIIRPPVSLERLMYDRKKSAVNPPQYLLSKKTSPIIRNSADRHGHD